MSFGMLSQKSVGKSSAVGEPEYAIERSFLFDDLVEHLIGVFDGLVVC